MDFADTNFASLFCLKNTYASLHLPNNSFQTCSKKSQTLTETYHNFILNIKTVSHV